MNSPDWQAAPRSSSPWDDWAGSTTTWTRRESTDLGYGLRVPARRDQPVSPSRGYIDHQTLSFDAYVKFIEDSSFFGGQRLDPRTNGRPDPRPDVREDEPEPSRPLQNDFDFNQAPLPPEILPVDPQTDLIEPARTARGPGPRDGPCGHPA